jgi:hypothetical protein
MLSACGTAFWMSVCVAKVRVLHSILHVPALAAASIGWNAWLSAAIYKKQEGDARTTTHTGTPSSDGVKRAGQHHDR